LLGQLWYAVVRNCCWFVARIAFRLRVIGGEQLPQDGGVLVLSNHQSHLDPVLMGIASPRQLRFLTRDTLFFWPLKWLIGSLGAIPINREGAGLSGLRTSLRILKDQQPLLVFPEGTRSHDGNLQPLQPGFCVIARRSRVTLVPVAVAGSFDALPRGRMVPRFRPIVVAFGTPIYPGEILDKDNQQLADLLTERLAETFHRASTFRATRQGRSPKDKKN
jgi:1-acyl-sn-glycerol-3-phosphate acyltransferase